MSQYITKNIPINIPVIQLISHHGYIPMKYSPIKIPLNDDKYLII